MRNIEQTKFVENDSHIVQRRHAICRLLEATGFGMLLAVSACVPLESEVLCDEYAKKYVRVQWDYTPKPADAGPVDASDAGPVDASDAGPVDASDGGVDGGPEPDVQPESEMEQNTCALECDRLVEETCPHIRKDQVRSCFDESNGSTIDGDQPVVRGSGTCETGEIPNN